MNVLILGTRGIPARHGGFETFAEDLAKFLVARGHRVTVYCQVDDAREIKEDVWEGIHRVHVPGGAGAKGTFRFDWLSVKDAMKRKGIILTLGYNTAVFSLRYMLGRRVHVMNMDGVEWKREKWSMPHKLWLWFNELAGARLSTHLIADHPGIKRHLERHTAGSKITVIPYGADALEGCSSTPIESLGLKQKDYFLVIARPEPENSLLEIVNAYSQKRRGVPLVVLGKYDREGNAYHASVLAAASDEVKFVGAIYEKSVVESLRYHARAYVHGHRVGGTNPSLVESLSAGNPIIAHNNQFTTWVAGPGALYFNGEEDLAAIFDRALQDNSLLSRMAEASRVRHQESFTQDKVLGAYEQMLLEHAGVYSTTKLESTSDEPSHVG